MMPTQFYQDKHPSPYRTLLLIIYLAHSFAPVVSSACYYDSITGRTICNGLPYGARLAIAAAVTIVGALALTGISYLVRKRFYSTPAPPPSVGYYGPPQTYPPNVGYAQPNAYPAQVPAYAPPPGPPPPGYNPYMYPQPPPKAEEQAAPQAPPLPGRP